MLTVEIVRERLIYEPDTGWFRWRTGVNAGKRAGSMNHHGYRRIHLDKNYAEHRLVWFYLYGYWPVEVDHENGVKCDNRLSNLVEVTHSQNMVKARIRTAWSWDKNRTRPRTSV